WKTFVGRLWTRVNDHDIFGRAAQLSYYFLLALFPLLLFLVTLLGYFADAGSHLRNQLLSYLATVMPGAAITLVHTTLDEISQARGGGKLSLGILAALWAASNGMGAISNTLNVAYAVKEDRPWWKVRLVAIFLTIAVSLFIMFALAIVFFGGELGEQLAGHYGFSNAFTIAWKVLQWPIALFFLLATFDLIYYFAPNIKLAKRRLGSAGAITAVVLWLLVSFGFRVYLHFFNSYSVTYGSLGALIVLMLWFYFTGLAILIGGEINSQVQQNQRQQSTGRS
ncbi:MAG TPA: YihY/virulence factor BrkB family protein, partial [Pyrinomonadaceae bacterium]|nr:YihY/virulence factor BrkB family protein [Pyrinomonadaceae bacterium]